MSYVFQAESGRLKVTHQIEHASATGGHLSVECAWRIVDELYLKATRSAVEVDRVRVESEFLFCLMGGFGITYEHGRSAADVIWQLRPFSEEWEDDDLSVAILDELLQPQFDPLKLDGTLRRYRYPRRKASIIVKARDWLNRNGPLHERLMELSDCRERRRFLSDCPGMGFKTASWLLRNLGLGEDLATIDVHVFRALSEAGRIAKNAKLPRDYELLESAFLEWCEELDASPAAFDLFIWHWQRGTLLET